MLRALILVVLVGLVAATGPGFTVQDMDRLDALFAGGWTKRAQVLYRIGDFAAAENAPAIDPKLSGVRAILEELQTGSGS